MPRCSFYLAYFHLFVMIGVILPFSRAKKNMGQATENQESRGNRDRYFKGQQVNEELVCFFRRHWMTVLYHFAFLILFASLEAVFIISFMKINGLIKANTALELLFIGIVILFIVYLHKIYAGLIDHFMNTVILTNSRVIEHKKSLFLHDSHEILDIVKIQDIKKSQDGILKNVLRYGELTITLSSSDATKLIKHVPNVNFHFRCLGRLKRDAFLQGRIEMLKSDETRSGRYVSKETIEELVKLEAQQTDQSVNKILDNILSKTTANRERGEFAPYDGAYKDEIVNNIPVS